VVGGMVHALLSASQQRVAAAAVRDGWVGEAGVCACARSGGRGDGGERGCLLDSPLAHLVILWVVVAGLAVAAEAVLAGGEALAVQLQAARVAAVARLAQLGILVLTTAAWRGRRAAFARQPRRAAQEGGLAP